MTFIPESIKRWLHRHSKVRWVMFLGGASASLTVMGLWLLGQYYEIQCLSGRCDFCSSQGELVVIYDPRFGNAVLADYSWFDDYSWSFRKQDSQPDRWRIQAYQFKGEFIVVVPLWMILLPCLAVTVIAWRSKPVRSNHCNHCDYDLTANESGRCPECGTAMGGVISEKKNFESTMEPIKTLDEALRFVDEYEGPPEGIHLPLSDILQDTIGANMAIITDRILARNWKPAGFTQKDGYRIYRYENLD